MDETNFVAYMRSIEVQKVPVEEILSPPFRPEFRTALVQILQRHGCRVEMQTQPWHIIFPAGTTKSEIYPRVQSERNTISLPDGYVLHETISCISGLSCLQFDIDDLPEDVQQEHQELINKLIRL